ncbi:MAG: hypothetical protein AB8H79_12550 [Myxococcota bacterium]
MHLKHGASALVLVIAVLGTVATSDDDDSHETDRPINTPPSAIQTLPAAPLRLTPDGPRRLYKVELYGLSAIDDVHVRVTVQGTADAEDSVADLVVQHVNCETEEPLAEQTWTLSVGAAATDFLLTLESIGYPVEGEWQTEHCLALFAQRGAVRAEWEVEVLAQFSMGNDYTANVYELER